MNPEMKLDINNERLLFKKIKVVRVKKVSETDIKTNVYDLKVKNNSNYVIRNLGLVHNGGKRQGAFTVALPIWHNDVYDFLDMQTETGDLRLKAYDVFPQLCVPDLFMKRDKLQQPWTTFCPFEVKQKLGIEMWGLWGEDFEKAYAEIEQAFDAGKLKVSKRIPNARVLTKTAMRTHFETGLPYITFVDTINKANPNKDDGFIPCTNLCTESYSNVVPDDMGHVCNLASIVLGNIKDMDHLHKVASLTCKILDYGISLTNNPDPITQKHNARYRTIGIGIQGLHDYLAREYTNFKNLDLIAEIAERIQYAAVLQSIELAKQYGPFTAFDKSEWKKGTMIEHYKKHSRGHCDWDKAQQLIDMHGIRNSQLTSPAPNTSTSIYMDSSASVQPVFKAFFSDDNKNGAMTVAAKFLKQNPLGYGKTQAKHTPTEIIDVVATMQPFVDTGISMELLLDHRIEGFTAKVLYDAIHYAHERDVKAIYYIRHIKKNAKVGSESQEDSDCEACAG